MQTINYEIPAGINPELLADELAAALGVDFDSIDTVRGPGGNFATVRVADSVAEATVTALIAAHNPAQKSQAELAKEAVQAAKAAVASYNPANVENMGTPALSAVVANIIDLLQKAGIA